MPAVDVETYPDTDALVGAAGDRLAETIAAAIEQRGRALVVLTGGGTGIGLLKRLREHQLDWPRVLRFWGDDLFVAGDYDEGNVNQAGRALRYLVDFPSSTVHPLPASEGPGGDDLVGCAAWYQDLLG